MAKETNSAFEWSQRIQRLLSDLKLTQAGLAERVGVSPATISRWVQGKHEPTAEGYVTLGNLAGGPEGAYFWERAGVDISGLPDASLRKILTSMRVNVQDFRVVGGSKAGKFASEPGQGHGREAVAVPLLRVSAYGDRVPPQENVSLSEVAVEDVLLAPLEWCPNPEQMIGMHLVGDSMVPLIPPGSVLFVDTSVTERDDLSGKLAVVSHRDLGFKVARLQRMPGLDLLVSANHKYTPLDVSNASKWKAFGQVLWWISRDTPPVA